jgi:EAL domain-containing protein (putative c-di-GMP-specific phosphodiesterase class I)
MLEQIKAQGICLAIDDFGTGYSSLSYLHRFPLNTVKIDRSFTSTMGNGGDGIQIVKTIMPLASNLGFDVVAEGVETQEQFRLLKELKCKYAQGYYFSKPLTAQAAEEFLAAQPSLAPV